MQTLKASFELHCDDWVYLMFAVDAV